MTTKVNLVLDDEVKAALYDLIPAGERSRFANEALRAQLAQVRQQQAIQKLDALRRRGPHVSSTEVLEALRSFRWSSGSSPWL